MIPRPIILLAALLFFAACAIGGAVLDTINPAALDTLIATVSALVLIGTLVAAFLTIPAQRVR